MKSSAFVMIIIAALAASLPTPSAARSDEEHWKAYSRTAMAITGDILLSPTRLRASGVDFPLKVMADMPDFETDLDGRVAARVLFVTRPMDPKLRNGNTLGCGQHQPVRWLVVWRYNHGKALGSGHFRRHADAQVGP